CACANRPEVNQMWYGKLLVVFTVSFSTADVLVMKLTSPAYTAVMLWLPTDKVEVVKTASPPLSVPVPSVVAPSLNVTVPVAVPEPGRFAATAAVKMTAWPGVAGFTDEVRVTVVVSWLTVRPLAPKPPLRKLVSPPYVAVML